MRQGNRPDMYFYRETRGTEVDVVIPKAGVLHLYEIKAGKTLQPDYNKNMKKLSEQLPVGETTVIYDGEDYPPSAINVRNI